MFYCFCFNHGFGLTVTFLHSITPVNRELTVVCILSAYKVNVARYYILFMLMGQDYVSELRPPMGLLFITQAIYECRKPWGKLKNLQGNLSQYHLSTTDPTWTYFHVKLDLCERLATNCLSYGMAY
jgi:hypothetical protein